MDCKQRPPVPDITPFSAFLLVRAALGTLLILTFLLRPAFLPGSIPAAHIDDLTESGRYEEALALLHENLTAVPEALPPAQQAEILSLLAEVQLAQAEALRNEGAAREKVIALCDLGWSYADQAAALQPSPESYLWRATASGYKADLKRNLESISLLRAMKEDLEKAVELDPAYHPAWFVLGTIHASVPGWPISFGSVPLAVSFMRRALYLSAGNEFPLQYYAALADMLWRRNWDQRRRNREMDRNNNLSDIPYHELEVQAYFEAYLGCDHVTVCSGEPLGSLSDREEAIHIAQWAADVYRTQPDPDRRPRDLQLLRQLEALPGKQ